MKRYRLDYLIDTELSEEEVVDRAETGYFFGLDVVDIVVYEVLNMPSFAEQARALRQIREGVISKEEARRTLGYE